MKKQMIPALVGFWLGHVVTSVLLDDAGDPVVFYGHQRFVV
jgi:hypothetical protein